MFHRQRDQERMLCYVIFFFQVTTLSPWKIKVSKPFTENQPLWDLHPPPPPSPAAKWTSRLHSDHSITAPGCDLPPIAAHHLPPGGTVALSHLLQPEPHWLAPAGYLTNHRSLIGPSPPPLLIKEPINRRERGPAFPSWRQLLLFSGRENPGGWGSHSQVPPLIVSLGGR